MLEHKIQEYKKRYYQNKLLKGSIFSLAVILSYFLLVSLLEYVGNFNTTLRAFLFFSFLLTALFSLVFWVIRPLVILLLPSKQLSNQEAASQIGSFFPEVRDRLLNTLQLLNQQSSAGSSDLAQASVEKASFNFRDLRFADAINLKANTKYLRLVGIPVAIGLLLFMFIPQIFTESTPRIVNFNKAYTPTAPFNFLIENGELSTFRNEDFELEVRIEGKALPTQVQLITAEGRKVLMSRQENNRFTYSFKKLQKDTEFSLFASGYSSESFNIKVLPRPALRNFNVELTYPSYIQRPSERIENSGNLIVPEGTKINWSFATQQAENLHITFSGDDSKKLTASSKGNNRFISETTARKSGAYRIMLTNEFASSKDLIEYYLNVIPDEYPAISVNQYEDTVLYNFIMIGGNVSDDYGITDVKLKYKVVRENESGSTQDGKYESVQIAFNPKVNSQSFYHRLEISSLEMKKGDRLEYFAEVWDNDGVNGRKSSRTRMYQFRLPSSSEMRQEIAKNSKQTEDQISKAHEKAKEIQEQLKEIQDRLKGKRKLEWQDKKSIEELIEKNKDLLEEVEKLQKMNELLNQKQSKNNSQENNQLAEKARQLQQLMDELLDEDTRRLYEELNQLLQQNMINKNLQDALDKIDLKQKNLENELERAIELFKRLKFESKTKEVAEELKELSEKQEKLAEETQKNTNEKDGTPQNQQKQEELRKQQEQLNEQFKDLQEELKSLDSLNQDLQMPFDMEQMQENKQSISNEQKNAEKQLEQNQNKKASESQKKAGQQMKQMAQQMMDMQQSAEMMELAENLDDLRKILENLLKLSFDQEKLMLEFRTIRRVDPRFVKFSQEQLKLKDDARMIEDSLLALSNRVFQIQSFVTREVAEMNKYMDESMDAIRKRIPEIASGKQQFAMTSINNLALLLNDILDQMQQQMSSSMSGKQMNQKKSGKPSMSQLQQDLNNKIQELKKSGKSGRELSEELAKLAAEQEMIRNALKQGMQSGKSEGQLNKNGEKRGGQNGEKNEEDGGQGGDLGKMLEQMEKTEEDLVNKRITQEMINRQQEILTRLLESEKAMKERELDEKREAESARKNFNQELPPDFSEYLKTKETQVELLKTIPTSLNPYYKQAVNDYFRKIKGRND